jgi:hypothetical protein
VGTEAPKFVIGNILRAVLLNILLFCNVKPEVVCVVSAIFSGLGAFIPHFDCNNRAEEVQCCDP